MSIGERLTGSLRLAQEAREQELLSPRAAKSRTTRGRDYPIEECPVRTCYQRDRDRVLHSKAFRRLKQKTQVFISPEGDHYRTRLTHTLEVAQISRTIARALLLNEDLTEAIALGHDLGHTPFGHSGEHVLDVLRPGFRHNVQSVRVVEVLEAMNLTWEVRDGILNHTGPDEPATLEGQVVRLADRIAYLNHDIDDAMRAGILAPEDLEGVPLGRMRHAERVSTMVIDTIEHSMEQPRIRMSEGMWQNLLELREFMFRRVYLDSAAKQEEKKAQRMLQRLFEYFIEHPEELAVHYRCEICADTHRQHTVDYLAGMTDPYAIMKYKELFLPHPWSLGGRP